MAKADDLGARGQVSDEQGPKAPRSSFTDFWNRFKRGDGKLSKESFIKDPDQVMWNILAAPVAAAVVYSIYKIKDESKRLVKYFKDEWSTTPEGETTFSEFRRKSGILLKYTALIVVGVAACIPGVSAFVGAAMGLINGVRSANRNEAGIFKTIIGAAYGAAIGWLVGTIPVVGVGIGSGLVRGSIEGAQDGLGEAKRGYDSYRRSHPEMDVPIEDKSASKQAGGTMRKAIAVQFAIGTFVATLLERAVMGVVKGVIPVIGLALVEVKIERKSAKFNRDVLSKDPVHSASVSAARVDPGVALAGKQAFNAGVAVATCSAPTTTPAGQTRPERGTTL